MSDIYQLSLGLTGEFDCSYLPKRQEKLMVVHPPSQLNADIYQQLLAKGFRRSGNDAYRPHCATCSACHSIRVPVANFVASKSQRRIANKNKDIELRISNTPQQALYFELYSRYISERHASGSMYPPTQATLDSFTCCQWLTLCFIEGYLDNKLVSVAVCDVLHNALSAVYTFFDPDLDRRSLGQFNILEQVSLAQAQNKQYLYLGYQIDPCAAMNYKKNYTPNERFIEEQWIKFEK